MTHLNKQQLQKLLSNVKPVDNSEELKNKKHSTMIRENIQKMWEIKNQNKNMTVQEIDAKCNKECFFLFKHYTQIYNLFLKKDLRLEVFNRLLDNLEKIENGEISQHDASIKVGQILKALYIDNVIEEKNEYEKQEKELIQKQKIEQAKKIKDISWKQFKSSHNNEQTSNNC
tara:strand:- start:1507 stop:2022 length:516 start_codon:yes stop_codon:yes gene_type:complete